MDYGGGDVEQVTLDANGVTTQRTFGNHTINLSPDALGRVRHLESSTGTSVRTAIDYDPLGRKTHVLDSETGLEEWFDYADVLGRLTFHKRAVQWAGPQPLLYQETRSYTDSDTLHQVAIAAQIDTGSGQRTTSQTQTLDALGRVLQVQGSVLSDSGPVNSLQQFDYDPRGNVVAERVSTSETNTFATTTSVFDPAGYLVERDEPEGAVTRLTTDAAGLTVQKDGPHPREHWTFSFDAFGQPTERKLLSDGPEVPEAVWTTEYRLPAATVKETDPLGYVTQRSLNARNKVLHEERFDTGKSRSSSNSLVSDFTYDGPWVAKRTLSEGAWSQTIDRPSIDDRGRVLREVESWSSDSRHYKYTTNKPWSGRSVSVTETWQSAAPTQTRSSSLRLDSLGNLISRSQDDLTDSWVYDAAGLLALEQPTGKPATVYTYFQGQLVQKDFASESTLYRYFPRGLAQSVTDPSSRVQRLSWYDRGLLKTEDFGRGTQVDHKSYTYDSGGYLSSLSTGSGSDAATWTYSHGPRGELLAASQLDSLGTFQYGYDARLQLTSIRPPGDAPPLGGSVSQSFDYDYLGRQVSRTRGTSSWVSSWANGESTATDPNSDVTRTLLDPRGRKARVRYQPGSASSPFTSLTGIDLDYDGLDQILAATELRGAGNVSVSYSYDDRSRLTRVDRGASSWVNFGYTSSDERLFVESPAGKVTFGYDSKDRLQSSSSPRGETQFSWEDGGQRLLSVSDSSLQECLGYDDRGRISHVANQLPNSSCTDALSAAFARFDYSYDDRGNRLSETYSDQSVSADLTSYGYDKADRLIGVQYPGGQTKLYGLGGDGSRICEKTLPVFASAFTLDACTRASGATEHLVYQYDARGGLSAVVDGLTSSQIATYEADPAGRVKREVRAGTERTYGWDAGGRLIQATITSPASGGGFTTSTSSYTYDFAGLRISKTTPAGTTGYLWGDGELVEERLPGQAALRYENAAGMTVAIGGERLLHDALGSVVGRVSSGSATLFRYDAWGGFRGNAPSANEPSAAYAGQHWDADSGLSYAQQRWYDPRVGRFLSEDPVAGDPASPNSLMAFGYANGSPATNIDPEGLEARPSYLTSFSGVPSSHTQCSKDSYVVGCMCAIGARFDKDFGTYDRLIQEGSCTGEFVKGFKACDGRPVDAAIYNSDAARTTREFWTASPGRANTLGCFTGSLNALIPLVGGDVSELPPSMQQSAAACQFAVGGATLAVALIEHGPAAIKKLRDALRVEAEEATIAATAKAESKAGQVADGPSRKRVSSSAQMSAEDAAAAPELTKATPKAASATEDVSSRKPPIIVGENMERVRSYAKDVGGQVYRPWKNDPFNRQLAMRRNLRWIREQMRQGREIIDIGPDFARRASSGKRSDFYEMERKTLKDYKNYKKAFDRSGTSGGVPGLDPVRP